MNDMTMEYVRKTKDEVAQMLHDCSSCLILFHVNPDGDCSASAFALKSMLEEMGKDAFCLCAQPLPERLQFIMTNQDGVTEDFIPNGKKFDLVMTVDTASPSQLGALYEEYRGKIDLMIDHHKRGTVYADNYIVPEASSCGEVIFGIFSHIEEKYGILMPDRAKYLVYTAISSDTGCFRYNNVAPTTFEIAAKLLSFGVPTSDINHKLFGIKSLKQMQVEHAGFERMNFYDDGKIAVITFPYDLKRQYGAEDENLETLIDVARCIKGVEVAAVVKQPTDDKRYRVSMRSSTDFDVSKICGMYGGGGHERAAGCTLICDSILAAEITIVSAIENMYADMNEQK